MKKDDVISKRDVLDFLWEWAEEKGNWAKLLLHEVLNTSDRLSDDTRSTIYRNFRKCIGLTEDIEDVFIEKPTASFLGHAIQLTRLSSITGLNRLSSDSVIRFSPNLTVIYGENGTGKSGFSRILKDIGYSYEAETKLLPNIYASDIQAITAKVEYTYDGTPKEYNWKPGTKSNELKDISIYNSSCVSISLSENRNLIVTPLGFYLFDQVSSELDALAVLLSKEKSLLIISYDWFESFHEGTEYQKAIETLNTLSKKEIEELLAFASEDEMKLARLEKVYTGTSKELIEKEIIELNTQYTELSEIKQSVENSKIAFNQTQWDELLKAVGDVKRLEEKGYGSLAELAQEKGIELFGKAEFGSFIKAADVYINTLPDANYPDTADAKCIYCNQALIDMATLDLIKRYKVILTDTTRQELEKQKIIIENLKKAFERVTSIQLHQPSYGRDENDKAIQPEYINAYNTVIGDINQRIEGNDYKNTEFSVGYDSVIQKLKNKAEKVEKQTATKQASLGNIETEKSRLSTEINGLKDKQLFAGKKTEILKAVENHLQKKKLTKNEGAFNTASISAKTSKARKELVEQTFEKTFLSELNNLRKGHIKVELNFGTKKGGTNIRQMLQKRYTLSDILSEGEQKAISLAEFFTELSIDGSNSAVIFDDPVNSLDHHIIDETSKRLIVLSATRQTVIFTHSILLFNSLLYQVKLPQNKPIEKQFYHTKNQYEICGVITEADEEINSPKSYISQINILINNTPKDRAEDEVASEGYGYLRSAIELTVEHEILQGTVKRYQKNIALTNFCKLSGAEIDKCKVELNNIFEKCCGYISSHSNPTEVPSTPDITQFKADFEAYKKIREVFVK
jgi:energy-coupling factor transporter ATP-binding protein EcfA2